MNVHAQGACALPFFMKAQPGERFCLYHQPNPELPRRGTILYVHPFAEELNKSRRMAALQSRAYARAGFGVLQIDLYGCGDSSGDFSDARWDLWLGDLRLAWEWLKQRCDGDFYLWGLRLGGLLALDFARGADPDPAALILWQPALSGRAHLTQFNRLHSAARLFGAPAGNLAANLAANLAGTAAGSTAGRHGEVAGYTLAPALAAAIDAADAALLAPRCPVQWLELAAPPIAADEQATPAMLQPASALLLQRWRDAGVIVQSHAVPGAPFWNSMEISECPALLAATLAATVAVVPDAAPTERP